MYTILGYNLKENKKILVLCLNQTKYKNHWMQVLNELKSRGVEDVFFISIDGVSDLEEGTEAIFTQRCNALRYILSKSKDYKKGCRDMKNFYGCLLPIPCMPHSIPFKIAGINILEQ